jgi:hypothetical protein
VDGKDTFMTFMFGVGQGKLCNANYGAFAPELQPGPDITLVLLKIGPNGSRMVETGCKVNDDYFGALWDMCTEVTITSLLRKHAIENGRWDEHVEIESADSPDVKCSKRRSPRSSQGTPRPAKTAKVDKDGDRGLEVRDKSKLSQSLKEKCQQLKEQKRKIKNLADKNRKLTNERDGFKEALDVLKGKMNELKQNHKEQVKELKRKPNDLNKTNLLQIGNALSELAKVHKKQNTQQPVASPPPSSPSSSLGMSATKYHNIDAIVMMNAIAKNNIDLVKVFKSGSTNTPSDPPDHPVKPIRAKFCSNCGLANSGGNFCATCGQKC